MGALDLVRGAVGVGLRAAQTSQDVVLALPRIATSLDSLSRSAADLQRIADAAPAFQSLAAAVEDLRRALADPANAEDVETVRRTARRLAEVPATLGPLAQTLAELNDTVVALSHTVSPLQGASERLGRLVDRLPRSGAGSGFGTPGPTGGRRVVDVDPPPRSP